MKGGTMSKEWVDFRAVKAAVGIQMVLNHYGVTGLKQVGSELRGRCAVHRGSPSSKHFTVSLKKNAFKCFFANCGARGNFLDFVAVMEDCSVRDAALRLKESFRIGETKTDSSNELNVDGLSQVRDGIYNDKNGAVYEVILTAASAENLEPLVLYRELFGDYRFWVGPVTAFSLEHSDESPFTLIKQL
jgi:hypothetical protein